MDAVYAWVDDQKESNRNKFYRFLDEQRQKWLPRHVFNRCCVKWLADGPLSYEGEYDDPYSCRNGCRGDCGREHPTIELDFDTGRNITTATLTHPELAPFRQYFQQCIDNGTAWVRDRSSYDLNGFLRENQTKLRRQDNFGSHLVTIAAGALEASDAAQLQALEEPPAKRPKTTGLENTSLFEDTMNVVNLSGTFEEDLDLFSIYNLRETSKFFRRMAMQIATNRLKTAKFYIMPLINGMIQQDMERADPLQFDDATCSTDGYSYFLEYTQCENVLLQYDSQPESQEHHRLGEASFVPCDPNVAEFSWRYEDRGDDEEGREYSGQKLRVFWRPEPVDGVQERARTDLTSLPSLGVEIGTFDLISTSEEQGRNVRSHMGVTLEYDVLESSEDKIEESSGENEEDEDEEDVDENDEKETFTRYVGRIRIVKLKVDFGALARQHALQLLRKVAREQVEIQRERPLKASEVAYGDQIEAAIKL